jgi:dephospho-CoA kinase
MIFRLGLTGSIGMGKTTTANLFRDAGCEVWDADSAVHRIYKTGGKAVQPIEKVFPDSVVDGEVSRAKLKKILQDNPSSFNILEGIVHPLVAQDRDKFLQNTTSEVCVFDIPLLFETGGDKNMDAVACVVIDYETQKLRVLERGTMTLVQFEKIVAKQLPTKEKTERSHYTIITDTLENAKHQVVAILEDIKGHKNHA